MRAYIQKYGLAFILLFLLIPGVVQGQQPIDSMVYTVYEEQYIFPCRKATPIDLFKAAKLYVSPENGYWGDVYGVPYDGKPGAASVKERPYTNGNIFNPPVSVADTGIYRFYFYFTSSRGYCGIKNNTRFVLNLYLGTYGCLEPSPTGELDQRHYFCFGSNIDMNMLGRHEFDTPVTIADLLMKYSKNPVDWKQNRMLDADWVDMDVYTDRDHKNWIGKGKMEIDLSPASGSYDTTLYVIIHQSGNREYTDSVSIRVYPQSKLEIFYSPTDLSDATREYDMDDQITITAQDSSLFNYYTFLLNNQNLNKYYLGGDTTKNEITLSALAFSGVEDFIEIIATDKNNCIARAEDNVIVRVPFPTVFTPDGDGINDIFLGGEKFRNREFHLEVFSRWEGRLYYGESGWDGTHRGNPVPPGTYLYTLIIKTADGSTKTIKGTVTLIRQASK